MSNSILELDQTNFADSIKNSDKTVLVDFWGPKVWPLQSNCAHTRRACTGDRDQVQICKVNIDNNSAIANEYSIRAIPTILIFKDGAVAETLVGLTSKKTSRPNWSSELQHGGVFRCAYRLPALSLLDRFN